MGVNVAIVDPLRLPTVSGGNYLARPGVNELRRYSVGSRNRTTTPWSRINTCSIARLSQNEHV